MPPVCDWWFLTKRKFTADIKMARILYGVFGEGMGHAIRSKIIIGHLIKKGHDVQIVASGKAFPFLSKCFRNTCEIYGQHFVYKNNSVMRLMTFFHNNYPLPKGFCINLRKIFNLIHRFKPQLIISDFEPFSVLFGFLFRIPRINIEFFNMSSITSRENLPKKYIIDYYLSRIVVRLYILKSNYHIVTSFSNIKKGKYKKNTYLFPPTLRDDIINSKVEEKNYILVYQTSTSNKKLHSIMKKSPENFVVYGFGIDKRLENITYKEFSGKIFVRDLANCKAVIANGSFNLISESIYLGKPILSIPAQKQCEQILNAIDMQTLGYGEFHTSLNEDIIKKFISRLEAYKRNLRTYKRENNSKLFNKLDFLTKEITK